MTLVELATRHPKLYAAVFIRGAQASRQFEYIVNKGEEIRADKFYYGEQRHQSLIPTDAGLLAKSY
jgi:hypothetical protein